MFIRGKKNVSDSITGTSTVGSLSVQSRGEGQQESATPSRDVKSCHFVSFFAVIAVQPIQDYV